MKAAIKVLTVFLLTACIVPVYSQAIKINDNGKVGIGGAPGAYNLQVNGTLRVTSYLSFMLLMLAVRI